MQRATFTVGAYRSVDPEPIGRGAFAEVFRGESTDGSGSRSVAIKVIDCARLDGHHDQSRLLRTEIDITRRLKHPNIVELFDVIAAKPYLYLILELADGGDLAQYLRKQPQRRLTEARARCVMRQLASGLGFLHQHHIVHRDLKPQNLLLVRDQKQSGYVVKIADFGFARTLGASEHSLAETMCGSPLYMAPEILRGDAYDEKADLWSVGVMTFEVLNGQAPFRAPSIAALQRLHVAHGAQDAQPLPWSSTVAARTSEACRALVAGLLRCDAHERMGWDEFLTHEWIRKANTAQTANDLYERAMRYGCEAATLELDGDTTAARAGYRRGVEALRTLRRMAHSEGDVATLDDALERFRCRLNAVNET